MSVQDDKSADVRDDKTADEDTDQKLTEKPEPDEDDKKKAADMMEAYKEKPTIVLPGTGGSVSGTAVNEWLDEDGNPKHEVPDDKSSDEQAVQDRIEKDKALNEQLREAATTENKGEKP